MLFKYGFTLEIGFFVIKCPIPHAEHWLTGRRKDANIYRHMTVHRIYLARFSQNQKGFGYKDASYRQMICNEGEK